MHIRPSHKPIRAGAARSLSGAGAAARVLLLVAAAALTACAVPARLQPGTTPSAAVAALGPPTAQYALPGGGQRLQYSEAPAGRHVWNADFDASGRLATVTDGLSYDSFNRFVMGQSTTEDVLRMLGPPGVVERVHSFQGVVWTYRFNDLNNPRFVHVHIDPAGVVQRVMYTDEVRQRDRFGW